MSLANIYRLGLKELKSLWADKVLLLLICWAFSGAIYTAATATSQELHNAPVAVVDEDQSPLSRRIVGAFYKPYFRQPAALTLAELDREMDLGTYNFTLVIPNHFQHDVLAGRQPEIQLNIDATIMSQAFIGATYIKSIALGEVNEYLTGTRDSAATPTVELEFELGGHDYRLTKSFLHKKRCELQWNGQQLDGTDAEDKLAELLGFQHAGKGAAQVLEGAVDGRNAAAAVNGVVDRVGRPGQGGQKTTNTKQHAEILEHEGAPLLAARMARPAGLVICLYL